MAGLATSSIGCASQSETAKMYGIIGRMNALKGKRDPLANIMVDASDHMPGCLSYIVAKDNSDESALWITEVWDSQESHKASLSLDSVVQAISRGRPLIASFGERIETSPTGGYGLS